MKYTKYHEAAHTYFHQTLHYYFTGKITYREFRKDVFKAVGNHRYSEAWIELADIAMHSSSVRDYETRVANNFAEIVYA